MAPGQLLEQIFVQFLNFWWKFKVSIESLISLKSSSSSGRVSSGIGESSKVHLVADLSERALTKGSFQLFFFSILGCHKDDLCLIHSSPVCLPVCRCRREEGRGERVIGLMGRVNFTHLHRSRSALASRRQGGSFNQRILGDIRSV